MGDLRNKAAKEAELARVRAMQTRMEARRPRPLSPHTLNALARF
jgi:hypothetical protein